MRGGVCAGGGSRDGTQFLNKPIKLEALGALLSARFGIVLPSSGKGGGGGLAAGAAAALKRTLSLPALSVRSGGGGGAAGVRVGGVGAGPRGSLDGGYSERRRGSAVTLSGGGSAVVSTCRVVVSCRRGSVASSDRRHPCVSVPLRRAVVRARAVRGAGDDRRRGQRLRGLWLELPRQRAAGRRGAGCARAEWAGRAVDGRQQRPGSQAHQDRLITTKIA